MYFLESALKTARGRIQALLSVVVRMDRSARGPGRVDVNCQSCEVFRCRLSIFPYTLKGGSNKCMCKYAAG